MVLTRLMATTNNVQGDEPPRSTLERQVQTLMTTVERLTKQNHDLEEHCVREIQDTMFKRITRKTVLNEGSQRSQRAVTHQVDQNGRT